MLQTDKHISPDLYLRGAIHRYGRRICCTSIRAIRPAKQLNVSDTRGLSGNVTNPDHVENTLLFGLCTCQGLPSMAVAHLGMQLAYVNVVVLFL